MNILIVDDHDVVRQSLARVIADEFSGAVCKKVDKAAICIQLLGEETFDLLILDMNLPDMDGLTLTEWIRNHYPEQMILIFTMNPVAVFAKKLYQLGIRGYLNKDAEMSELIGALRTVLIEKKIYFNPQFKLELAHDSLLKKPANPIDKLSGRELTIAQLIARGKSNEQIAIELNIGHSTMRTYKSRIFQKLEINTLHEFLTKAAIYNIK
jgi:DNA-binding NarL/FixJ family response regulator